MNQDRHYRHCHNIMQAQTTYYMDLKICQLELSTHGSVKKVFSQLSHSCNFVYRFFTQVMSN